MKKPPFEIDKIVLRIVTELCCFFKLFPNSPPEIPFTLQQTGIGIRQNIKTHRLLFIKKTGCGISENRTRL
ncbi:hypothetical protein l13_17560 [Neisseria weaveri ATCC 51223]|nr:hypothetical protein l13_17560 [Neisseria weaveri ATCC 51223]